MATTSESTPEKKFENGKEISEGDAHYSPSKEFGGECTNGVGREKNVEKELGIRMPPGGVPLDLGTLDGLNMQDSALSALQTQKVINDRVLGVISALSGLEHSFAKTILEAAISRLSHCTYVQPSAISQSNNQLKELYQQLTPMT